MIVTLSAGHYGGLTVQWPADAKRVRIEDAQGQGWIYSIEHDPETPDRAVYIGVATLDASNAQAATVNANPIASE